jgi:homoserine acetyltransferase
VPALVVVTTADSLMPTPLPYELLAAVPGAHTAEPATGHPPFLEQSHQWPKAVTGFLAKQGDARKRPRMIT